MIVAAHENKKRWKDIYTAGHGVGNIDDVPTAAFECETFQSIDAGTHRIYIGRVVAAHKGEANTTGSVRARKPAISGFLQREGRQT